VDHRLACQDAIHPDARMVHRVVLSCAFRLAHHPVGVRGPDLKRQRLLVRHQEVVEADATARERLRLIQRGAQHFLQRVLL